MFCKSNDRLTLAWRRVAGHVDHAADERCSVLRTHVVARGVAHPAVGRAVSQLEHFARCNMRTTMTKTTKHLHGEDLAISLRIRSRIASSVTGHQF